MKKWLIWSIEHEGWWKPAWRGYTKSRAEAGRYTFTEATKIVRQANIGNHDTPNEAMVLEVEIPIYPIRDPNTQECIGHLVYRYDAKEFWIHWENKPSEKVENLRTIDIMKATRIIEEWERENK